MTTAIEKIQSVEIKMDMPSSLPELQGYTNEDLFRELMRRTFTHLDMKDPSIVETPKRVAKFWREFNQKADVDSLLARTFDNSDGTKGMVVQTDVPVACLCEHHLLPFFGTVDLGYIPNKSVVGLSKLARLVKALGHERPTVQETLTERLASLLYTKLDARGVIVVVRAEHTCMTVRGAQAPGVLTTTSTVKGILRDASQVREEFFELLRTNRRK